MQRKLVAILAADVVGYSLLMGENEDKALAILREFRAEVLGPTVAGHRGRLIKSMGDGWLVEFASTVDAVNCALRIQERLTANVLLKLRIGIHIGDVVHEDEDIFGDGVNIAARLQDFADPGGLAISGSAYDSLDGTLSPGFTDSGLQLFKNIARPVQVWTRFPSARQATHARPTERPAQTSPIFPSLAIRPVERDDGRAAVHDLADALAGDLVAALSSSDWLDTTITGHPRHTAYVVDAVLRSMGDLLRLEIRLDAPDGDQVWTGHYDGLLGESFDWRDRVGRDAAANVFGAISDAERQRLLAAEPATMSAADCLLCGVLEFYDVSQETLASAMWFLDLAITKDRGQGAARVQLLRCIFAAVAAGHGSRITARLEQVPALLGDAARLSGESAVLTLCAAIWDYRQHRDAGKLHTVAEAALRRAPFDPDILCLGGWCYVWLGVPQQALDCFRKFVEFGQFSSLNMVARGGLALAHVQLGRDHAAIEKASAVTRTTSDFVVPYRAIASAAGHLGDKVLAGEAIANMRRLAPEDSVSRLRVRAGFADTPANQRFLDGLRRAGLPE